MMEAKHSGGVGSRPLDIRAVYQYRRAGGGRTAEEQVVTPVGATTV